MRQDSINNASEGNKSCGKTTRQHAYAFAVAHSLSLWFVPMTSIHNSDSSWAAHACTLPMRLCHCCVYVAFPFVAGRLPVHQRQQPLMSTTAVPLRAEEAASPVTCIRHISRSCLFAFEVPCRPHLHHCKSLTRPKQEPATRCGGCACGCEP